MSVSFLDLVYRFNLLPSHDNGDNFNFLEITLPPKLPHHYKLQTPPLHITTTTTATVIPTAAAKLSPPPAIHRLNISAADPSPPPRLYIYYHSFIAISAPLSSLLRPLHINFHMTTDTSALISAAAAKLSTPPEI